MDQGLDQCLKHFGTGGVGGGCLYSDSDIGSVYGLSVCIWLKQQSLIKYFPSETWKNVLLSQCQLRVLHSD